MVIATTDTNKRYYWLKLKDDFFKQKEIKQLRKMAGGDTFTIIYLKMLLRSLKDNGRLYYEGIEQDFVSELALDLDEEVENVKLTVAYLTAKGILIQGNTDEYSLLTAGELTGSESYSAERMRRLRSKKLLASQSDARVTASDEEIDIEIEKREKSKSKSRNAKNTFTIPTLDELKAYALEIDYNLDAEAFIDYYSQNGWVIGKNKTPMRDWKAAVRTWKRNDEKKGIDTHARHKEPDTVVLTPEEERLIAEVYARILI